MILPLHFACYAAHIVASMQGSCLDSNHNNYHGSAVQDALLHPALPLLVWLMAAVANGYQPDLALRSACLAVVHNLALVPVQDHLPAAGEHYKYVKTVVKVLKHLPGNAQGLAGLMC